MNFAKFLRTPFFYRTTPLAASATGIFHKLVSYEKLVSYMSNAKWQFPIHFSDAIGLLSYVLLQNLKLIFHRLIDIWSMYGKSYG